MSHFTPEPPIRLLSNRLEVEVSVPGSFYRGTRFDWTGFITQVTLDGEHTFCVPEDYRPNQGTGGTGLCNEFGIDAPIGFTEADPGDPFPKLGIGLLKRDAGDEYAFHLPYEIVEPFPVETQADGHQVIFVVQPVECRGYAARLTKTLRVWENSLEIDYRLENTGSRPILTNEYVHNFLGFDGQLMGPDYRLHFPYLVQSHHLPDLPRQLTSALEIQGHELGLNSRPQNAFYCRPLGFFKTNQPQWSLHHNPSGQEMSETDDFAPLRVAVWGTTHVISPEIFIEIDVKPGETQAWKRVYEFKA